MSAASKIAEVLNGRPNGSDHSFMMCCPVHDDRTPSLHVSDGPGGKLLVKCHAGCAQADVVGYLKEMGLWPDSLPTGCTLEQIAAEKKLPLDLLKRSGWRDTTFEFKGSKLSAVAIPYRDIECTTRATQLRVSMTGDRFRWEKGGTTKAIYGLEHFKPDELTLLVEGSTDVLTARLHGFHAVGVAAAGGWNEKEHAPILDRAGAIFFVQEPDDGGMKLRAALAKSRIRKKVRVVRLDGAKDLSALHCADEASFKEKLSRAMQNAESLDDLAPVVVTLDAVEQRPLEWLVQELFPLGKITMIAGDPGLGKSLLTVDGAAVITTRPRWPWVGAMSGDVLMLSAEDDPADTIKPRFIAAGGDPKRLHLMTAVRDVDDDGNVVRRGFSLLSDVERLAEVLRNMRGKIRAVIIDPISAYLGATDSHNNAEVRAALMPLAELAATERVAVIVVSHLNKNSGGVGTALYRVSGSLGFTAAARAVFAVSKDPEDDQRRLFLALKMNLAPEGQGFAYRVVDVGGVPRLEWEMARVAMKADEAFISTKTERDREVEEWLTERLSNGPKFAPTMWAEAENKHFSRNRVKAAQKRLGLVFTKDRAEDGRPAWTWALRGPKREEIQPKATGRHEVVGRVGRVEGDQVAQETQEDQLTQLTPPGLVPEHEQL